MRELDRLADRGGGWNLAGVGGRGRKHAEADEVFGVHGFSGVENGGRSVRTYSEGAAGFVLLCRRECASGVAKAPG